MNDDMIGIQFPPQDAEDSNADIMADGDHEPYNEGYVSDEEAAPLPDYQDDDDGRGSCARRCQRRVRAS
jgi:hypothetical protein